MTDRLTEAEQHWAKGWVRGLARILAMGPPSEKPEEYAEEVKKIEKVGLEPGAKVYEYAKRWRRRLIEVLAPETA